MMAIKKGCNLIIAHHPIIFSGIKQLTGKNHIERVVIKAIQNNISIYVIHTNLDNVLGGVNTKIVRFNWIEKSPNFISQKGIVKKTSSLCT